MKSLFRTLWMILLAAIILFIPLSCKKTSEEPPGDQVIIPATTKVITTNDWNANLISIDSIQHTYVFRSAMLSAYNLKSGDVIVSNVGKGCLRKVTGIITSGDQTTITTSFANMSDAIEDGSFTMNYHLTPDKIKSVKILDRQCKINPINNKSGKSTNFTYELSTYLDENEQVEINATLTIDPTISCSYKIKHFTVKNLNIEFKVEEQISVTATLTLLNIEWEKEKKLLEVEFTPITVMIGPVPVVITPGIEVNAGINLNINSAVTSSVIQSLSYTVGIAYNSGNSPNWTNYTQLDKSFTYNPPQLSATAEAKAYIKPQFNLEIYGVLSPYLFAELYGRIEADLFATPWWSLYAGAGIGAGVKVEVWGYTLIDYETDPPPILYEILIASAPAENNEPPVIPFNPVPVDTAMEVGISTSLSWSCTDPDNDPLTFDVYFGTANPPPLVQSNVNNFSFTLATLANSTVYYWKIEAKDDHGNSTPGPLWRFATESSGGGTGVTCPGTASIIYEGTVYHTTLIGTQCWLKENLNAGNMINSSKSQTNNSIIEKYCYQNLIANCTQSGGLYTWDELMNYSATEGAKGICPPGWHVPTDEEWKAMEIAIGMSAAEADLTGWRGTDQGTRLKPGGTTGFDALMAGIFNLGFFSDINVNGYLSTSSSPTSSNIWVRMLNVDNPKISRYQTIKQNALSVRCLKD